MGFMTVQWKKTAGRDGCDTVTWASTHPKLLWMNAVFFNKMIQRNASWYMGMPTYLSRQVWKITFLRKICAMCYFEPCHAWCTHSLKAPQSPITNPGAPSTTPALPPHPTPPWPINTSQSPVTDGCRGQQGLAGAGRGLAKVRPGHGGVWDCCDMVCLSVSMQVDE